MNIEKELKKLDSQKLTENGDVSYNTTGNNLIDLLFMAEFFSNNLDEVSIGESEQEKLFAMYMRDPRFGKGYRDLGRTLLSKTNATAEEVVKAGRFDDLYRIGKASHINLLHKSLLERDPLARKWAPRLHGKDHAIANLLRKHWGLSPQDYRKLIKNEDTVEYKKSYHEVVDAETGTPLDELFGQDTTIVHPLLDTIDFSKLPSRALLKYFNSFLRNEQTSERFQKYLDDLKEGKVKINTGTTTVHDAYKLTQTTSESNTELSDVVAKEVIKSETKGLELSIIPVLDTSGSMTWSLGRGGNSTPFDMAMSIAHALATNSTYAKNQVISFSSNPQLMTIKGNTLREQYESMITGDCSNTDLAKVFELLKGLKSYPKFICVLSDMEFDEGASQSRESLYKHLKENHPEANTRIIWWNFNNRSRTVPEFDEYGNIFMSGFDLTSLLLVPEVGDMEEYLENILYEYKKNISK